MLRRLCGVLVHRRVRLPGNWLPEDGRVLVCKESLFLDSAFGLIGEPIRFTIPGNVINISFDPDEDWENPAPHNPRGGFSSPTQAGDPGGPAAEPPCRVHALGLIPAAAPGTQDLIETGVWPACARLSLCRPSWLTVLRNHLPGLVHLALAETRSKRG